MEELHFLRMCYFVPPVLVHFDLCGREESERVETVAGEEERTVAKIWIWD